MKLDMYKDHLIKLAQGIGIDLNYIHGIDCFKPIIDKIREDSSTIIIKIDGERTANIYTLLVSGNKLGVDESIRIDTSDIEGGLSYICVEYARKVWGWQDNE